MAKSDFICKSCGEVKKAPFLSLTTFHKYTCPNCGAICQDCVKGGSILGGPKCLKCGSKVIRYSWNGKKWQKS